MSSLLLKSMCFKYAFKEGSKKRISQSTKAISGLLDRSFRLSYKSETVVIFLRTDNEPIEPVDPLSEIQL